MSRKTIVVNFLNEVNSSSVKSTLEGLKNLIEELEDKNDPEMIEVEIVNVSYQLFEKLELLQSVLRKYVTHEHILTGDKLENLYDDNETGTSTLFKK